MWPNGRKRKEDGLGMLRCRRGGHLPQAAQIGQQHRQCNENTDKIGGGGSPGYAIDADEMIEQRHQQNIGGPFAYQGKEDRLGPLAGGLEYSNGKEDEGAGGAGQADDLQEGAPMGHRFGIIDEPAGDRGGPKVQQHGDEQRDSQTTYQ